jgi:hypothetical protein
MPWHKVLWRNEGFIMDATTELRVSRHNSRDVVEG